MRDVLLCLHADEDGAAFIEYTALLGVVLAVGLAILSGVGLWVTATWSSLCTSLQIAQC